MSQKLNVVLFGPPGAGKGTQSEFLIKKYGLVHLSTGDLLRAEIKDETPLGVEAKEVMDRGELVGDHIVIGMIRNRIEANHQAAGFIFDGFPRTLPQADALKSAHVALDVVLEIAVPDADIIERMSGRRVHVASGRSYHVRYNPPKVQDRDDLTGEPLIQRDDDQEDVVRKRLEVYHAQTQVLVEYYASWAASGAAQAPKYRKVSGVGSVEEIKARVFAALES